MGMSIATGASWGPVPDIQGLTTSMLVEGNLLVHETTWHGRHTASLKLPGHEPVAPTNELIPCIS